MFIGAHAMLPVVIATATDMAFTAKFREKAFSVSDRWAFGFCGILPDILSPHIGLHSRLTSFSHTLWFVMSMLPVLLILSYLWHRRHFMRFALCCWIAVTLHLLCDMISGGIAPLYPLSAKVIGFYHISPKFWIPLDVLTISLFLTELVLLRKLETKSELLYVLRKRY
jgi:hypothetical protein